MKYLPEIMNAILIRAQMVGLLSGQLFIRQSHRICDHHYISTDESTQSHVSDKCSGNRNQRVYHASSKGWRLCNILAQGCNAALNIRSVFSFRNEHDGQRPENVVRRSKGTQLSSNSVKTVPITTRCRLFAMVRSRKNFLFSLYLSSALNCHP